MRTYTLAIADDVLFVCLPDEADIGEAIQETTATAYGAGIELEISRGAVLTDRPEADDHVIWADGPDGELTDAEGRAYRYAVRRRA
ncbi:hypothetical protein [Methylobacterium gregans]|uniref:Uncharacterized protein n=1 Tax=Methylobacterium gregans TaxID=374424 RepID=A0AA37HTU4_9HYPH|nr:hypothetical protein [Methylobacterium gregans]MDQ0522916.1 hypothetical protein [Methylobacterium gregans]GJD81521.1 hypothetical protein NBEOAGPD_4772 [Methylobacterium gregans]GLS55811.1 hypothetical protein GCM10007886_39960 [Methylobacterium gregans]